MIEQLEIKNFRGFSEYKIEDIGQVNLLVGTNNSGKTSVLEAVHLLKSRGDASCFFSLFVRRGERIQSENPMIHEGEADLCRLFHGFTLTELSSFSISCFENNLNENLTTFIKEFSSPPTRTASSWEEYLPEEQNDFFPGSYTLQVLWNRKEESKSTAQWGRESEQTSESYPISVDGGVPYSLLRRVHINPNNTKSEKLEFVPASSLTSQKIVALFDKTVLTSDEQLVLDALKIIEPDIIRLASLGGGHQYPGYSSSELPRGGIFVKSSKWEERIPIGSFGDGIWRLLGLILSLVGAKNGTLLIDEIDTGLHHTVMSKMWKLICITAKKLNVQVFATTHSSDCWKTLADNAVEDEFADMPIRIHRINKDKKRPETFTNKEMHLAVDHEIEVR